MSELGDIVDGRYRLTRELGQGGMGSVYEAEHTILDKKVAIKILRARFTQSGKVVQRFYREARTASQIGHEGIVEVIDVGMSEGSPFLVMELLSGESLGDILKREQQLTVGCVLTIAEQVLSALVAVHERGIIHRDLKPDNIFLCRQSDGSFRAKLLDFGICKILDEDSGPQLTATGDVLGTPFYMSPEQARGSVELDHRTDIWSLGVILYEALTGQVPFEGGNYNVVIAKLLTEDFKKPREHRHDLPINVERVLLKAMARSSEERYRQTTDFLAAVVMLLGEETTDVAFPSPASEAGVVSIPENASVEAEGLGEPWTIPRTSVLSKEPLPTDPPHISDVPIMEQAPPSEAAQTPLQEPVLPIELEADSTAGAADTFGAVTTDRPVEVSRRGFPTWLVAVLVPVVLGAGGAVIGFMMVDDSNDVVVTSSAQDSSPSGPAELLPPSPTPSGSSEVVQPVPVPVTESNTVELPEKQQEQPDPPSPLRLDEESPRSPSDGRSSRPTTRGHRSSSERGAQNSHQVTASSGPPITREEVRQKLSKTQVRQCVTRGGGTIPSRVIVRFRINDDGGTTYMGTTPHFSSSTAACIRSVVAGAQFRATGRQRTFSYPVSIGGLKRDNPLR